MAIANFYKRAAVAASQVVAGFNEDVFRKTLENCRVGVAMGSEASNLQEGRALADLSIRLLARLYPVIELRIADDGHRAELEELARSINPDIELVGSADTGLVIGPGASEFSSSVYVGSKGWLALLNSQEPMPVGNSGNPFGAGGAACLGAANLFRRIFVPSSELDARVTFDLGSGNQVESDDDADAPWKLTTDCTLAGVGAIGNGAVWALARSVDAARVRLVDPETVELSNLQRYVLCDQEHVDQTKTSVTAAFLAGSGEEFPMSWAEYTEKMGYVDHLVLVALDSARDRRQVQASLPEWVVNAWTQPADLGVSIHGRFGSGGACLACLYLPEGQVASEDQLVAEALGVPQRQLQIRELLAEGVAVPEDLLAEVASALELEQPVVDRFRGSSVRELYSEGLCGGALVPLERLGSPRAEMHVPLAHQSTMAGLLLAAAAVLAQDEKPGHTEVIRVNLLRPLGLDLRQRMASQPAGCYCSDHDFVAVYAEKWARSD
jgi:hypothetical protein